MDDFKICEYPGRIECHYNVGNFLRFIKSRDQTWRNRLDIFTDALERRVSIDKTHSNVEPIYTELDHIVKKIASGLQTKLPYIYGDMEVIPTGSQTSGVKVGLPHEADFLFKLPSSINYETFQRVYEEGTTRPL